MSIYKIILRAAQIVEGYVKWLYDCVTGSGSIYSLKRLVICRNCEHNKKGICNQCGCIIKAKVRVKYMLDDDGKSIEGCPEKKW